MVNEEQGGLPPVAHNELSRVTTKVPPFWRNNPALWFCQLESQFATCNIVNDKTKYHTVVGAMDASILVYVSDIVLSPPQTDMYPTLKNRLLEQFTESEQARLKKLLSELELGDKRPSQLMREMRALANAGVNDDLLKNLWVQRLPAQLQAILSTSSDGLDKMVIMADKIFEVTGYAEVSQVRAFPSTQESKGSLEQQISVLTKSMNELRSRLDKKSQPQASKSFARSRSRSRSRAGESQINDELCWYHRRFSSKATKCRPPCKFAAKN